MINDQIDLILFPKGFLIMFIQDYNVGVRITPRKYTTICYWVHGDINKCNSMAEEQKKRRPYVKNPHLL